MASRTKDKLIDVARQLFAHKGVENTTMNDIASASDKGRRTIYTYFKSKTEIFNAVVNREAQSIIERIADIPSMPISPEEKLMNFIFSRFEAVKEVVGRNGSLKASFFLDVRRVEPYSPSEQAQGDSAAEGDSERGRAARRIPHQACGQDRRNSAHGYARAGFTLHSRQFRRFGHQ